MSVLTKTHHTKNNQCEIIIKDGGAKKIYLIKRSDFSELEKYLEKYANQDDDSPVAWEELAKERIEKYKKAGLVLRGMRYRENMSQVALSKKSGVSQNEISNIENGKRTVGEKIAKKLADALNFNYLLLLEQ
ncbi:MAG: multiprotein-bridging factor 1 family protein [Chlamydiales bacterium]